jgi:hypothetical protein
MLTVNADNMPPDAGATPTSMQQQTMKYQQKVTKFAEQLTLPFILSDWYTLWRTILRDLPHPEPSRTLITDNFKTLSRWCQVNELMRVILVLIDSVILCADIL